MKAIQTIYNQKDFQSSIITTDKSWSEVIRLIHNALGWNKLYDKDVVVKRESYIKGIFMPYLTKYWVLIDDEDQFMITYLLHDEIQETMMLQLVED